MEDKKKFYPDYLIEILIVIFLAIESTVVLALLFPQEIGREIDFISPFLPRPEWYFLWLFEIMRYFHGNTIFIGTVLIPLSCIILLISIPFIDTGKRGRFRAGVSISFVYMIFIIFTIISVLRE